MNDEEEGEEKEGKAESPYYEPPEWIQKDPIYREAFMKESAKHIFDQRIIAYKNQQNHEAEFQSASMEIIKDAASNAGKSLIILNGAAAIAVLTNVASGTRPNKSSPYLQLGRRNRCACICRNIFSPAFFSASQR